MLTPQETTLIENMRCTIANAPYNDHYQVLHISPMDGEGSYLITTLTLSPKPLYGLKRELYTLLEAIKKETVVTQSLLLVKVEDGLITVYEQDAEQLPCQVVVDDGAVGGD